jgi:RNA polymerase sigma-70 factor (ECF subfamily)
VTVDVTDARRQWLSELYKANAPAVFKQCRRLLKSPEDAADATQEIFLRAATSLSEDVVGAQAGAWLNTVARNYCIDLIRRRERLGSAMTTLGATADAPAAPEESVENRELLLAVLPQLGVRERQALWQSAVEDLPLSEIARSLGISYLAAAKLLSRARQRALVLATRLAIILGLTQLGQAARRGQFMERAQRLAGVVAVPVAVALIITSSSSPQTVRAIAQARLPITAAQIPPPVQNPITLPKNQPPAANPTPAILHALPIAVTKVKPAAPAPTKGLPKPAPRPVVCDKDHGKGLGWDELHGKGHKYGHFKRCG